MTAVPAPDVYAPPEGPPPRAVYLHVPFCQHRCGYCDFTLVAQQDELIPKWLSALANELGRMDRVYQVDTIFIGGGTPTHLTVPQLREFFYLVRSRFQLADQGEFSIEANPDGLTDEKLALLAGEGVNRISLGVQAFDNDVLATLERTHQSQQAQEVISRCVEYLDDVSLDLIFGVPGQTIQQWQATLQTAVQLPVSHISTYGLTFEKGTAFEQRRRQGNIVPVVDELEREMYALSQQLIPESGRAHYETSNFARPGHECRHNMVYWDSAEYFGFGPGAARYVNGVRSTNARNVRRWITDWLEHRVSLQDHEKLDREARAREAIYLALRLIRGLDVSAFESRFAMSLKDLVGDAVHRHVATGMLELENGWLRLTQEGRFVADSVMVDLV